MTMAKLDLVLFLIFGLICISSLTAAIWSFSKALSVSGEKDGDLKMFMWAVGTLFGLIVSGMSAAYILLPILFHK